MDLNSVTSQGETCGSAGLVEELWGYAPRSAALMQYACSTSIVEGYGTLGLWSLSSQMPVFLNGNSLTAIQLSVLLNWTFIDCLQRGLRFSPLCGNKVILLLTSALPVSCPSLWHCLCLIDFLSTLMFADSTTSKTENPPTATVVKHRVQDGLSASCRIKCRTHCDTYERMQRLFPCVQGGWDDQKSES